MHGWRLDSYWFPSEWDTEDTRQLITRWIEEGRRAVFDALNTETPKT